MLTEIVATSVVAFPKAVDIQIGEHLVEFSYKPKRKTHFTRRVVGIEQFAGAVGEATKSKKGVALEAGTVYIREPIAVGALEAAKFEQNGAMTVAKGDDNKVLVANAGFFNASEVLKTEKKKPKKDKKSDKAKKDKGKKKKKK